MRICLLLPGFSADDGDWFLPELANYVGELSRQAEVVIYTLGHPFRRATWQLHGATIHCLFGAENHFPGRLVLWSELKRRIKADNEIQPYDVIHGFGMGETGFLASRIGRSLGIPSVFSFNAEAPAIQRQRPPHILPQIRQWLASNALHYTTIITTGSAWKRNRLPARFRRRVSIIPMGVDTAAFSPMGLRTGTKLLAASSVCRENDYATLLCAFAIARHVHPEITLDIAGMQFICEMELLEPLIRELNISDAVRFLGPVPFEYMRDVYRECDLLLSAAKSDLQGMSVLEALATGMPIVASDVGSAASLPEEIVHHFMPGDVQGMADQILDSLAGDAHASNACVSGPVIIGEHFSVKRTVSDFLNLYERLQVPEAASPKWERIPDQERMIARA